MSQAVARPAAPLATPSSPAGPNTPRTQVKISPYAVVCSECEIKGNVTIGARTVIHPKVRIIAEAGAICIGENNLIEEQVELKNTLPDTVMTIGDSNVFEVSAVCHALQVGDSNVFEAKSYTGAQTIVSNGCTIGAMCSVTAPEELPENTVICGEDGHRRVASERPPAQTLQLDFLTKILPNYHHLVKLPKAPNPVGPATAPTATAAAAAATGPGQMMRQTSSSSQAAARH